jgi:outer membrane protein assembly factor BamD (BamD/ComL family)
MLKKWHLTISGAIFSVIPGLMLGLCLLSLPACSEKKAEELYKTAAFEELQTNWAHACQLYERIAADYPKSTPADRARVRLSALTAEGKCGKGDY